MSGYIIWTLERIGLVKDVYRVTPEMLSRRSAKRVVSADVMSSDIEPVAVEAD